MEKLEQIKEQILPILKQFNVQLYELNWQKAKKSSTLQIAIMHDDGSMDLDTCANVSEKISEILDGLDLIQEEYFLEVCSPGEERVLRNQKEVNDVVGKKVYVHFCSAIKNLNELTGVLKAFDQQKLTIEYRDKAVSRTLEVAYDNVDFIRLSV